MLYLLRRKIGRPARNDRDPPVVQNHIRAFCPANRAASPDLFEAGAEKITYDE